MNIFPFRDFLLRTAGHPHFEDAAVARRTSRVERDGLVGLWVGNIGPAFDGFNTPTGWRS